MSEISSIKELLIFVSEDLALFSGYKVCTLKGLLAKIKFLQLACLAVSLLVFASLNSVNAFGFYHSSAIEEHKVLKLEKPVFESLIASDIGDFLVVKIPENSILPVEEETLVGALVTDIDPEDGMMLIEGASEVTVAGENKNLYFRATIDPGDIDSLNQISGEMLMEAELLLF